MIFNSIEFLIFFVIVVFAYFTIPHKFRWAFLLAASYYFYMCWKPLYVILIMISTLSVYISAIQIEKTDRKIIKNIYFISALIINFGLLFVFKYFNFFNESISVVFKNFNIMYNTPTLKLLLPVGISFYTFQVISYLIDVTRGTKKAERHLGIFALFVSFFPQLVAGPIERSSNLLPQFYKEQHFSYQRVTDGLKLMAWGFFKKVVIADRVAAVVNEVYNNPTSHSGAGFVIATLFFAIQVYCDFSGYSDIAIGAAQVLGFKLMKNFNRPYSAKSLSDFWRRWHISLSTWLNDYIYTPILIRTRSWASFGVVFSLIATFFISGLWHGAAWTYVLWGLLHGFGLAIEIITKKKRKKIRKKTPSFIYDNISLISVFIFVNFTYIFFRANTVADAFYIIRHIPSDFSNLFSITWIVTALEKNTLGINTIDFSVAIIAIIIMEIVNFAQKYGSVRQMLVKTPIYFRWTLYFILVETILLFGKFSAQEFIYFQF